MKKLMLLIAAGCALIAVADILGEDFTSAVNTLANTRPIPSAVWIIAINKDPQQKAELTERFNKQLAAVATIHAAHKAVDLTIVMPFLSMTADPRVGFYHVDSTNIATLGKVWPVLALIADMPNAAEALQKFSLDKSNYLDYRMDALHILSLVDRDRFKATAEQFKGELAPEGNGPVPVKARGFLSKIIDNWENGKNGYDGTFHLPPYLATPSEAPPQSLPTYK